MTHLRDPQILVESDKQKCTQNDAFSELTPVVQLAKYCTLYIILYKQYIFDNHNHFLILLDVFVLLNKSFVL